MRTLVVAGMHRSGTSLTARWLASCGLHAGEPESLSAAALANPRGQYEDEDFVRLHEAILRQNGFSSSMVGGNAALRVSPEHEEAARKLLQARQGGATALPFPVGGATQGGATAPPFPVSGATPACFGWKDPRTTLFLRFWKRLVPDLRVLAVYRPPAAVVDSLLRRRRARTRRKRPASLAGGAGIAWLLDSGRVALRRSWWNLSRVRAHAAVWARYNSELLEFAAAHPDDLVLFRIDRLREQGPGLIDALNARWGLGLRPVPIGSSFEAELLRDAEQTAGRGALLARLAPRTVPVQRELERIERDSRMRLGLGAGETG